MDYYERMMWVRENADLLTLIITNLGAGGLMRLRALHQGGEA